MPDLLLVVGCAAEQAAEIDAAVLLPLVAAAVAAVGELRCLGVLALTLSLHLAQEAPQVGRVVGVGRQDEAAAVGRRGTVATSTTTGRRRGRERDAATLGCGRRRLGDRRHGLDQRDNRCDRLGLHLRRLLHRGRGGRRRLRVARRHRLELATRAAAALRQRLQGDALQAALDVACGDALLACGLADLAQGPGQRVRATGYIHDYGRLGALRQPESLLGERRAEAAAVVRGLPGGQGLAADLARIHAGPLRLRALAGRHRRLRPRRSVQTGLAHRARDVEAPFRLERG
jgi:hypothetical protein